MENNSGNSYMFANGKKVFKFKADNEIVNFPTQFCLGSISNEFCANDFLTDYDAIVILIIRKYLMIKNIKYKTI